MDKLKLSYAFIGFALFIYVISGFSDLIETLCLVSFFLNGFLYTYSFDYLPKTQTALQSPSVFLYRRQRLNLYGYLNSGIFIGMTILFFLLQAIFLIKLGIIIFFCWGLMILLFKIGINYSADSSAKEEILFEYMFQMYPQYQELLAMLSRDYPNYPMNEIDSVYFDNMQKFLLRKGYSPAQTSEFINNFAAINSNLYDYSSDEVREIDKGI